MFKNAATGMILWLLLAIRAVGGDIFFSGDYREVPFDLFASDIEGKTGAHFFYRHEWISGALITAKGDNLSLTGVLQDNLAGRDLSVFIDEERNVFITPGILVNTLPKDSVSVQESSNHIAGRNEEGYDARLAYFGRRQAESIETLIIGDVENNTTGARVVINGKIRDKENSESVIGATIYLPEQKTGSVTDIDGRFYLVLLPGKYQVRFSCIGMKEILYYLEVYSDGQLNIAMEREIIPINEVTVTADRFDNVRGILMGFERLDMKTIKEIPLIMGEKDLMKVAQMLPGIQSVGEGATGFNVRGSATDQNMIYINKVPVYNTSHLFGFFSSFNPDIVKDFSIYKGNIPVQYGGRLASIFDITTRQGNKNSFTARGGISPITGHVAIEGPIKKGHSSFVLSSRSTYSDWLLSRLEDPEIRNSSASFYDVSGVINIESNEKNLYKAFGHYTSDRFRLADLNKYDYSNSGGSFTWRHTFSPSLSSNLTAVLSNYSFTTTNNEYPFSAYRHEYRIGHYELTSDLTWVYGRKHTFTIGGSTIFYDLDRGDVVPSGSETTRLPVNLGEEAGIETAIYIGDKIVLRPWLTFYGGIRYGIYSLLGPETVYDYYPEGPKDNSNIRDTLRFSPGETVKTYSGPEIRAAFNISTGNTSSVKISYNRNRQYLFMLSNTIAISPTDQWKLCDYHITPPYCDQFSAGFYKDFNLTGLRTSAETYYKWINEIVEYRDGADFIMNPYIEEAVLQGKQNAWGIEFMLEKKTGKVTGWISYCYSRSHITVNGNNTWEKINRGLTYPANYDKPHALDLTLNYRVNRRLSISSNLVYNTGRPVTYPVSVYYLNGQEYLNYSSRNKYRLPDYFRTDISINLEGNLKARKKIHSFWMLNIYNLTGRKNAYSVYFRSEEGKINGYKMSIFGTRMVTLSWNFKLGNYASE